MSSGISMYYCDICLLGSKGKRAAATCLFRHHLLVHVDRADKFRLAYLDHHKRKPFKVQCEYCLKMLWKGVVFKHHVTYHSNIAESDKETYRRASSKKVAKQCDVCQQEVSRSMFYAHFLAKHIKLSDADKHICDHCECAFRQIGTLAKHWFAVHTAPICEENKKSIECDICLKEFHFQNDGRAPIKNLYQHFLVRHSGVAEKFVCDEGDHVSTTLASLWKHINWAGHLAQTESGKPSCDICGVEFLHKKSVLNHHRSKHGNKKELQMFHCDQCDFSMNMKCNLSAHIMEHCTSKGVRYQCEECERMFKSLRVLCNHKRRDHKKILYACDDCDRNYTGKEALLNHCIADRCISVPCSITDFVV